MAFTPSLHRPESVTVRRGVRFHVSVCAPIRLHGPMMQRIQTADPDVAYVRGEIAHHQGAIDMAKSA